MKKNIQIKLLETCEDINKIIVVLKKNEHINLLADIQDLASIIFDIITNENDVDEIIDLLRELYKICYEYASILEKNENIQHNYYNLLVDVAQSIKESISLIKCKIHIAFFPYNASMWDCMESVYLAAKEDANVDAFVVPIPYYKIENGRRKLFYEGNKFPDYIPITDYKNYNLDEIEPDIAYIHNPYDKYNKVTQIVDPFCSYNLKKYVKTLVYIPYYSVVQFSKHHLFLPAYEYVDYIVIAKQEHKKDLSNYNDEDKLLVLGSPKYDKIMKLSDDYSIMPDEWKKIANGRKIVFYSVGIAELLRFEEDAIDKMEMVFNIASKRNDICLLFRPHPLYESTLHSMKPELLDKYLALKDTFISNHIGIYDDTPDISIPVAICSAFMGERSSVMFLFDIQGKPRYYTNINIKRNPDYEDKNIAYTSSVFITEDKIWYIASYVNKICYIDRQSGKITEYLDLKGDKVIESYRDILVVDKFIIICPWVSQEIIIVDEDKNISKIDIGNKRYSYIKMYEYNKKIYFIPNLLNRILVYDIYTKEIRYIDISELNSNKIIENYYQSSYFVDDKIYLASRDSNKILVLDLTTDIKNIYVVGDLQGYINIIKHNDYIYLNAIGGEHITILNEKTGESKTYYVGEYFPEKKHIALFHSNMLLKYGDDICMISVNGDLAYKIYADNGSLVKCKNKFIEYKYFDSRYCYLDFNFKFNLVYAKDEIGIIDYRDMSLSILNVKKNQLDCENEVYKLRTITPLEDDIESYDKISGSFSYFENYIKTIDKFFDYVKLDPFREERKTYYKKQLTDVEPQESGKLIHQTILSKHKENNTQ